MKPDKPCIICGNSAIHLNDGSKTKINCPRCGNFFITDILEDDFKQNSLSQYEISNKGLFFTY